MLCIQSSFFSGASSPSTCFSCSCYHACRSSPTPSLIPRSSSPGCTQQPSHTYVFKHPMCTQPFLPPHLRIQASHGHTALSSIMHTATQSLTPSSSSLGCTKQRSHISVFEPSMGTQPSPPTNACSHTQTFCHASSQHRHNSTTVPHVWCHFQPRSIHRTVPNKSQDSSIV
jgi:hypothetical protein